MTQKDLTKLFKLKVVVFWHFLVTLSFMSVMIFDISFAKAAEQAKASPALVAKDPSTSTNKKEEEDLAKGEEVLSMWLMWPCLHHLNESKTLQAVEGTLRRPQHFLTFSWRLFARSYRALAERAASAAPDLPIQPLPQRLQPVVLAQV